MLGHKLTIKLHITLGCCRHLFENKKKGSHLNFTLHIVDHSICFAFVCLFIESAIEKIPRDDTNIVDSVLIFSIFCECLLVFLYGHVNEKYLIYEKLFVWFLFVYYSIRIRIV